MLWWNVTNNDGTWWNEFDFVEYVGMLERGRMWLIVVEHVGKWWNVTVAYYIYSNIKNVKNVKNY